MRKVTIDYPKSKVSGLINNKYAGYLGEHNATTLEAVKPVDLVGATYCFAFMVNGEVVHSRAFAENETISVELWQQVTQDHFLGVQLEAYDEYGEYLGKSALITLVFDRSAHGHDVVADTENDDLIADINANTAFRNRLTDNADTLDKLSTSEDNTLLFDGKPVSSGGSGGGEDSGVTGDQATQIEENTKARHTHSNKSLLDKLGTETVSGTTRVTYNYHSIAYKSDIPGDTALNKVENKMRDPNFVVTFKSREHLTAEGFALMSELIAELYARKTDIYTQEEIDQKISLIPKFSIKPIDTLPETDISETTVYLLKDTDTDGNLYTEYIYVDGVWEKLGTQSVDVDLTEYAKVEDIPTKTSQLENDSGFITKEDIPESDNVDLSNYYNKQEIDEIVSGLSSVTASLENASVETDEDGSGIVVAGGAVV